MEPTGLKSKILLTIGVGVIAYGVGSSRKMISWNQAGAKLQAATFIISNVAYLVLKEQKTLSSSSDKLYYLASAFLIGGVGFLAKLDWKINALMTTLFVLGQYQINQLLPLSTSKKNVKLSSPVEEKQEARKPPPAQNFQDEIRKFGKGDKVALPDKLAPEEDLAYRQFITVSQITEVKGQGSLYLGSFEAVSSLESGYKGEDCFFGVSPADSGFPAAATDYPENIQKRMKPIYQDKKRATAENLDIKAVVTVGYSSESPNDFLPSTIEKICVENISEMSHKEFMLGFKGVFAQIFNGVKNNLEGGRNVLIHCNSGEHRSPIVTIALVMRLFDVSKEDAIKWVRSKRPIILPNSGEKLNNLNAALKWVDENKKGLPGFLD